MRALQPTASGDSEFGFQEGKLTSSQFPLGIELAMGTIRCRYLKPRLKDGRIAWGRWQNIGDYLLGITWVDFYRTNHVLIWRLTRLSLDTNHPNSYMSGVSKCESDIATHLSAIRRPIF